MFVHIFAFQWKDTATSAQVEAAVRAVLAFRGVVDGLSDVFIGRNVSDNAPQYTTTAAMMFVSREAYDAYVVHPAHVALLDWLIPLIDPIELDFEALPNPVPDPD